MTRTIAASALAFLASAAISAAPPEQAPPPRVIPLVELVKQLESDDYQEREAATKRLSALALEPPPELLAAARSENPELRERASKATLAMRSNLAATRLPRGQKYAEDGRVDLFVAATAVWDLKPNDRRLWLPAFDLGRRLLKKGELTGRREPNGCPSALKDYEEFVELRAPRYTRVNEVYIRKEAEPDLLSSYNEAIQAPGVAEPKAIGGNLIISRGNVKATSGIGHSLVLANGDISARTIIYNSVLVCDGDVSVSAGAIMKCLVVARGNITAAEGADTSVLMAGGKVTLGKERLTKRQAEAGHYNVVVEGEPNTLGLTFFELLDTLGLVVRVADGNVIVDNYKLSGAFAKTGAELGDIITAVNGKKPDSAESLRRLLRDALAVGDATLTLRRGEKTETVKISLTE
jgi:hypothetical protein